MIREIFTYISEFPRLPEARTFGHLTESISLLSREKRCQTAWLPHRTLCKSFISEHLKSARHFDSVLVLGSGPLHEIPIEVLAKEFKRVVLVDVVHLKSTRQSISHLTNVEMIEHEISEIERDLMKGVLADKVPQKFLDENWGLILSVNIMSQLPIHLESFIERKLKKRFQQKDIEAYLKSVTKNHYLYLQKFHAPIILITDVETYYYDKKDKIIQTDVNYDHLNLPKALESWNWNIAPIPEFQKDVGIRMKVCGFLIK